MNYLNYQMVKKLEEAGFPNNKDSFGNEIDFKWIRYDKKEKFVPVNEFYFSEYCQQVGVEIADIHICPTLSELINACGEGFINLYNFGNFWQTNFRDGMAGETSGNSPEEAVANLWLKLNKK